MVKRWLDRSRTCPSCNQPHHFVYVEESQKDRTYWFICPATNERAEFIASEAVECGYGPVDDDGPIVVPAIPKLPD